MKIRIYPDSSLRTHCLPVTNFADPDLEVLSREMARAMKAANGAGLAANQVGVPVRMVVLKDGVSGIHLTLINPSIIASSGYQKLLEKCLSIPGIEGFVRRPSRVTVEFWDLDGQRQGITLHDYMASVVQHEIDHLDGKLFTDRLDQSARMKIRRKLEALEAKAVTT